MKLDTAEILKVFGNTFSQLIIRFSGAGTTFLVTLFLARFLGVDTLGSFIKVTSFVAIFYLLIDFGLNTIYLKDYFHKTEELFGNLLLLRFLISSSVFLLVLAIAVFLPHTENSGYSIAEKIGILIYSFTIFTEGILVSFNGLLQKNLLQKKLVMPSLASSVVTILLVLLGVWAHNLFIILASYPIGELVQVSAISISLKNKVSYKRLPASFRSFSRKSLFAASPLALMLFLNVVYFRADSFILALLKSATDVGLYGFSYKVFEFLISVPTFLSASVFPILIAVHADRKLFRQKIFSYAGILLAVSGILTGAVFLLSPLVSLVRSDLAPAVIPLRILSFSLPFFFLTSLFQWAILLQGKIKLLLFIYGITMVLNVILNVLYIPVFSYIASSYITLATEGLVFLLMLMVFLTSKKN
ncbi:MAG: oligosaccharide flippase family protein [Candidatus Levyibacteriota bacterium]